MRRVVTGYDKDGRSVVVSDGPVPRVHRSTTLPGWTAALVWATETDEAINQHGIDPTDRVTSFVPAPGSTRLIVLTIPPDALISEPGFDLEAFNREQLTLSPGIAQLMEADHPGMHATPTVDYAIVLHGQLTLELDDDQFVKLEAGDIIVQNGTRHGWRNHSDSWAVIAFTLMGAKCS